MRIVTLSIVLAFGTVACATHAIMVDDSDEPDAAGPPPLVSPDASASSDAQSGPSPDKVLSCVATECPAPRATCLRGDGTIPYPCETNLFTDDNNCGECGNVCPTDFLELNMSSKCVEGKCVAVCSPGAQDCNGRIDDGCETYVALDPNNCGTCGNKCPEFTSGISGCGVGSAPYGVCNVECKAPGTRCAPKCTDLRKDPDNCGDCGVRCESHPSDKPPAPPHMFYTCDDGTCGHLACDGAWRDCNNDVPRDGCEIDIANDPLHCGGCGNVCAPGQVCLYRAERGGYVCGCEPTEALCGRQCADLLSDVENCGGCGFVCSTPENGTRTCRDGFCASDCLPGWGDCDGDVRNGCETKLDVNPLHCGACGNQCDIGAGQPCVSGRCVMTECDGGAVR